MKVETPEDIVLCDHPIHPASLAVGGFKMLSCVLPRGHRGDHIAAIQDRSGHAFRAALQELGKI